ncbi:MAG TPA: discoidin domain-containing protein [Pilimelia sp.]|nr:discoidin domain-containing protein [Pilimelia sp.]
MSRAAPDARRRATASGLAVAAILGGLIVALPPAQAESAATPVQVWMTTSDGARRLTRLADTRFAGSIEPVNIAVSSTERHQSMVGFGASVTEASAHLVAGLPGAERTRLVDDVFSPSAGIGLNFLRQPMGGTDFVAALPYYTYDDSPTPDPSLARFSIERDRREILPLLRQALAVNPGIRVMASPWSAPAWMKDSGSLLGGSLRPEYYDAYARYFVRFIEAYAEAGVPVSEVTPQNEPLFTTSYPSMSMTSAQQATFIRALDQALTAAAQPTKVLAYDHNWDRPDYPLDVFARAGDVARLVGAAFHCYGGQPEAQRQIRQAGKRVYFTECSGTDTGATTFADSLRWQSEHLVIRGVRSGAETVVLWNLALDAQGGPHFGHCGTSCNGLVEVANGTYARNADYYVVGHLSKFVRRGAVHVGSNTEGPGGLQNVAFHNPDGSRVLFVLNATNGSRRFSATDTGNAFGYELPAGAAATFVWPGAPNGGSPPVALDRSQWLVTGSSTPSDPCCTGDVAGRAIDGAAATRWATGRAQAPGQWFAIDLGSAQEFTSIVLDAGSSSGDHPRGYAVYLTNDSEGCGGPVASGAGTGPVTTIAMPSVTTRYVRIVLTANTGNWWSIHEINLYR